MYTGTDLGAALEQHFGIHQLIVITWYELEEQRTEGETSMKVALQPPHSADKKNHNSKCRCPSISKSLQ